MPDRPRLEAVLLDAGGTLVRLDFEWMSGMLRAMGIAVAAAALRRGEIAGRRAYDGSRGTPAPPGEAAPPLGSTGDTNAYFGGTLRAAGVPDAALPEALRAFHARQAGPGLWTRPMEGAREALDGLAELGLALAVVSNSDGRAEQHLLDCGVRQGLAFVVDSHVEGVEKPDPAIFRVALARLAVPAAHVLFVGDIRSVDEAGAHAAGMPFVLIDPWGDYALAGTPAIARIAQLPQWIASQFEVPGRRVPPVSPRHS